MSEPKQQTLLSFDTCWDLPGEWVEPPNLRRNGESGVKRVQSEGRTWYLKRQSGHTYRSLRHPFGQPTILREQHALATLTRLGISVPNVLFCGAKPGANGVWQAVLLTEGLDGYQDLAHWLDDIQQGMLPSEQINARITALGRMLAQMHRHHWQHGCLYDKHVFVAVGTAEPAIALLDLEKARRRWSAKRASTHDMHQLRRHCKLDAGQWQLLIDAYCQAFPAAKRWLRH